MCLRGLSLPFPNHAPKTCCTNPILRRRSMQKPDITDGPWQHDLHDTVVKEPPSARPPVGPALSYPNPNVFPAAMPVPRAPPSSPPNRSFSSTVLVGNVPVIVYLPGMKDPISFTAVPKKQHTRLPQHRPPLRRDKPVRISLPGQPPRYIFPAIERSFIFIPRALRPNQQAYRGRGRGGFYGGRRPSVYAPSSYAGSLPMSRRSSMGRDISRTGVCSPAASIVSRSAMVTGEGGKPIVRLPPNVQPSPMVATQPMHMPPSTAVPPAYGPPPPYPAPFRESRPQQAIPMHQPRPQKTVSVADIESPMTHPPPPLPPTTQEQPFHQQVPHAMAGHGYGPDPSAFGQHTRTLSHQVPPSGTPLSHIPERAIHAPPFQPLPYHQQPPFYPGSSYPPAMYPVVSPEYPPYSAPPPFMPPGQQMPYGMHAPPPPPPPHTNSDQSVQTGTVSHESNGTVYYYDASQFAGAQFPNAPYGMHPQGGVVGMGGMLTPPGPPYYYPQPPPPNGTIYYS
jgi:hypothetical protein